MTISPISNIPKSYPVLNEQIYGYKHGIRPLVLQTFDIKEQEGVEARLKRDNLDYFIKPSPNGKNISAIFGDKPCVDVIKSFGKTSFTDLSPEKDFILGVLLGYDKTKQCERYLKLKEKENSKNNNKLNVVA